MNLQCWVQQHLDWLCPEPTSGVSLQQRREPGLPVQRRLLCHLLHAGESPAAGRELGGGTHHLGAFCARKGMPGLPA